MSRSGRLACTDCDRSHALPTGTAILESTCECGLPRIAVTRGERFEVCADRGCDPLDTAVSERFNRRFDDCPDCDSDLRVVRVGGLLLGCDAYPDCDVSLSLPTRESDGTCAYGLATFDGWCLDPACASPSP